MIKKLLFIFLLVGAIETPLKGGFGNLLIAGGCGGVATFFYLRARNPNSWVDQVLGKLISSKPQNSPFPTVLTQVRTSPVTHALISRDSCCVMTGLFATMGLASLFGKNPLFVMNIYCNAGSVSVVGAHH